MGKNLRFSTLFYGIVGILVGLGIYVFIYAKGYSYMSDDPQACINCHIMRENLDTWSKSTHHHVAKCNDCHLPHNIIGKYAVKALNGFNHSAAFTLQNYPDPIRIRSHSLAVVKNACVNCHAPMIANMDHGGRSSSEPANCLNCHRSVGHAK